MKTRLFVPLLVLFSLPVTAAAATLSLAASPTHVGVGDVVRIGVFVESATSVNAFSGTLSYPTALLEAESVSDGNSVVNFWAERPTLGKNISFAGITPGGFAGKGGQLFSVLFRVKAAGTAVLDVASATVLRNDGAGGSEPVSVKTLRLALSDAPVESYAESVDRDAPEPFSPTTGSDAVQFGGRTYIAFSAVDKASGIDGYFVAESRIPRFFQPLFPLRFSRETSPYVLSDQTRASTIYVKAVDRAGNVRFAVVPPLRTAPEYVAVLAAILMTIVLIGYRFLSGRRDITPL